MPSTTPSLIWFTVCPRIPLCVKACNYLAGKADMIVVSATPLEALVREWEEHDIAQYVRVIAGQEMGKKQLHLELAAKGKYTSDHILMVGDAPGDMRAAKANGALFYPINPGHEEASGSAFTKKRCINSWLRNMPVLMKTALIEEFEAMLPDTPPWKK